MKYSRFYAVCSLRDFATIHTSCFYFFNKYFIGKTWFFRNSDFFHTDVKHS